MRVGLFYTYTVKHIICQYSKMNILTLLNDLGCIIKRPEY